MLKENDFDIAHPCPFKPNPLDPVAPYSGAADVMPAALVFENSGNQGSFTVTDIFEKDRLGLPLKAAARSCLVQCIILEAAPTSPLGNALR